MNKTIILIVSLLVIAFPWVYASSWEIDLSTMSPKEVLEYYKANPDHWKKRLELDYEEYIKWDYVVFRWEYKDINENPIPNKAINYSFNGDKYSYVTSEEWVFNLELKKEDIEDSPFYTTFLEIDWYKIKFRAKWKALKEKSIYHFSITRTEGEPHTLNLATIHNGSFWEGTSFFDLDLKTKKEPSRVWIQWIWLYVLLGSIGLFIGFFYFRHVLTKKKEIKKINIPSSMK